MDAILLLQTTGTLVVLILFYDLLRKINGRKKIQAPKPKGAWPIIGHIPLLAGQNPLYRTLGAMADKHGPIFRIQLGFRQALVVSSKEAIEECLTTNDRLFITRPKSASLKYMGYNGAFFALAPYGPLWSEMRKISVREVLSDRRLELLKHVRSSEVAKCIKELYSVYYKNGTAFSDKFNMSNWVHQVTTNLMTQAIARKRYNSIENDGNDVEAKRFREALRECVYLVGAFDVSDVVPFTEWMDMQGQLRSMKRVAKELDYFLSSWLDEHIQSMGQNSLTTEERDIMDVLLSLFPNSDGLIHGYKRAELIKATVLNFFLAATDTTSGTVIWALSLLLNHKEALKRAQEELDIVVGKERWVEESDIKHLEYLQAIVKETLRLYTAGPLALPREALEDCTIAGYHVPKGTQLLVNLWKLQRDPETWTDPCEFKPERFLTSHAAVDIRGKQFVYIPFSYGRRACPGMAASFQIIHLTLARVLQSFTLATPLNEPVDMSEGLASITMPKKYSLEVVLTPRLPCELYLF